MRRMVADGRGSLVESTVMTSTSARVVVFLLLVASIGLLIPGLFAPVLTIRGVLTRDGIAQIAPTMLQNGLSDETMAVLKSVMNPTIVAFIKGTGGDLRKNILDKLTPQVTASLAEERRRGRGLPADPQHCRVGAAFGPSRESGAGNADSAVQRDRAVVQGRARDLGGPS